MSPEPWEELPATSNPSRAHFLTIHKEDDTFWAECPDFPGCFVAADTLEELRELWPEVLAMWKEAEDEANAEDPTRLAAPSGPVEEPAGDLGPSSGTIFAEHFAARVAASEAMADEGAQIVRDAPAAGGPGDEPASHKPLVGVPDYGDAPGVSSTPTGSPWTDDPGDVFSSQSGSQAANVLLRELMTAMGESLHARDQSPSEVWVEMLDKIWAAPVLSEQPEPADDPEPVAWRWLATWGTWGTTADPTTAHILGGEGLTVEPLYLRAAPVPSLPDGRPDAFLDWATEAVGWHRGAFPTETLEQLGLCAGEEMGELLRTILKQSHGANDRRAHIDWPAERAGEIADVMVALVCIAERDSFDLMDELWSKLNELRERWPGAAAVTLPAGPADDPRLTAVGLIADEIRDTDCWLGGNDEALDLSDVTDVEAVAKRAVDALAVAGLLGSVRAPLPAGQEETA